MSFNYLERVLNEFNKLAQLPRPSHHEEKISAYLCRWAEQHSLYVETDSLGEVIMEKSASPGKEDAPTVILQAHMDMVCVAEDGYTHDFLNDPILVKNDGVTLTAEGTSLGADNGIGMAVALAVLSDDSLSHGPLRVIFTTNEEDGMDSKDLDAKYLTGDYLINLDWESCGSVCVSSAGGDYFQFGRRFESEILADDWRCLRFAISGLSGGHSGLNIHKGNANAIVVMADLLYGMLQEGIDLRIAAFDGGSAANAIPSICQAEIAYLPGDEESIKSIFDEKKSCFTGNYSELEPAAKWNIETADREGIQALTKEAGTDLIRLIVSLPDGVHTYSPHLSDFVESSSNLGLVKINSDQISLDIFARSSVAERSDELQSLCRNAANDNHFVFECNGHVPGWPMNPESRLTQLAVDSYFELTGEKMLIEPVHAGLECGAFLEKNPALDMISIGPSIHGAHTTDESCEVASIEVTARLVGLLLSKLAEETVTSE